MTGRSVIQTSGYHPRSPNASSHQVVLIRKPPKLSLSFTSFLSLTMLKRQRPSSPLPIPVTYGDDLSLSASGSTANMSVQVDPSFGISRKRPRVSPDITPGVTGVVGSGSTGRHTFFSPPVLSKRRRSPDPMDDSDDSKPTPSPQFSNSSSGYQRESDTSDTPAPRPTIDPKRRRTAAPVLEGSSRGWGPYQPFLIGTGPDIPSPISYPYSSFDPTNPPPGWILETQVGEYARENARLYDLHTLRPRFPHPEEAAQDQNAIASVGVDMEEKVVKERYGERNKYVPPTRCTCLRITKYLSQTTWISVLGASTATRRNVKLDMRKV